MARWRKLVQIAATNRVAHRPGGGTVASEYGQHILNRCLMLVRVRRGLCGQGSGYTLSCMMPLGDNSQY